MKVLIADDFITTKGFNNRHLSFLMNIIKKLDIELFIATENNFHFSRKEFCNISKIPYSNQKLIDFDENELSTQSIKYILRFIKDYDLIIGYELSKKTKLLFENQNVKYIDIWLAPIRFHKDLMFCFYSNVKSIQERLKSFSINEESIYNQAEVVKNHSNNFLKTDVMLKKNSALIIGQLSQDKAVLSDGKFLSLRDYKKEIVELSNKHSMLYFLKHPFMSPEEFTEILNVFNALKNIKYLKNVNTYQLLSKDEIKTVAAISSSVVIEAKYFHKNTLFFHKPVIDSNYVTVYNKFYSTKFWNTVLDLKSDLYAEYLTHDNFLRYHYNAFWSYDVFIENSNLITYKKSVQLFEFCQKLDKSKVYILYGYGSIAKLLLPHIQEYVKGAIDKDLKAGSIVDGIEVLDIHSLTKQDNVILTPFLYSNLILKELEKYHCNIINI